MISHDRFLNRLGWYLLANKYKRRECVIVGNGPSVTLEDLQKIQKSGKIIFVCNRFYLAYEQMNLNFFKPHFVVSIDPQIIQDFGQEIIDSKHKSKVLIGTDQELDLKGSFLSFPIINRLPFEFCSMPNKKISTGSSVVIAAIQLAYYMGMRKIYLYGIDHNFNYESKDDDGMVKGGENHFIHNYRNNKKWYPPLIEEIEQAFEKSDAFLRKYGGMLINCSRVTKLPNIERRNLNDCL